MVSMKLVLIAILLIIGCVAVFAEQGEAQQARDVVYETDEEILAAHRRRTRADENSCTPPERGTTSSSASSASASSASASSSASSSKSSSSASGSQGSTSGSKAASTGTKTATTGSKTASTTGSKSASTTGTKTATTTTGSTKSSTSSGSSTTVGLCDLVPTSSEPLKLLVPLYVYPGSEWTEVATAAGSVDIIAIINPNSGPDPTPDSSYTTYMAQLHSAGVELIGYVHTSYGDRSISDVEADVATYHSQYPLLTGIFFDEASDSASEIAYYTELYNYVTGLGYVHNILNPGTQPDEGYLTISTSIVVFEDSGSNLDSTSFSSWVTCATTSTQKSNYKYKFSIIAYDVEQSSAASMLSSMEDKGVGLVYVTDGASGCCTYNDLVSYFAAEASSVAALN